MKKITTLLCITVLLWSICACSNSAIEDAVTTGDMTTTKSTEPMDTSFDLSAYKKLISSCTEELNDGTVALSNVVNFEYNYWEALNKVGGRLDPEEAVAKAMEWLEEKSDYNDETITRQYDKIATMYKEIIATTIEGAEAEEILTQFKKLYESYIGLYDLAMAPSGNISSFASTYNDYANDIQTSSRELDILLS